MDGVNLEELRDLVEFLKASGISEFEMERTELKLRLKFEVKGGLPSSSVDFNQLSHMMAASQASPAPVASSGSALAAADEVAGRQSVEAAKTHEVKSPIVGTFYESPSPGAPAFVKVGDQVEVGQVLCIIEAMKLMNEIESDVAGEIVQRVAVSGGPVEYGQPLFAIKLR